VALEALLFSGPGPHALESLAQSLGLSRAEVQQLITELDQLLTAEESALMVESVAGGVRLATREEFHPWLVRAGLASEVAAMAEPLAETLAVVAYRQPVTRAEIDHLRGGPSTDLIRQLLERRLIKLAGRQKTLGRPAVYRTTRQFLEWLGLTHPNELPPIEGFPKGEPGAPQSPEAGSSPKDKA